MANKFKSSLGIIVLLLMCSLNLASAWTSSEFIKDDEVKCKEYLK